MAKDISVLSKWLFLLIFLLNTNLSFSTLSFTYPTSIALKNGNFFVIHKDGICVCNSGITKIIRNSYVFNENEKISENSLVNVTIIQFSDGFIISFIKNKLYYFDINGIYLDKSGEILSQSNIYISIASYKMIDNRYYYFLIGYIYNKSLYLYYYKYDFQENGLSIIASEAGIYDRYEGSAFNIQNKGVSCQMLYKDSRDIIECMYFVKKTTSSDTYVSRPFFLLIIKM